MDLSVDWLGLRLAHPFIAGASPLGDDLDLVRRLEDAGGAAIVMRSLFEEQISHEQMSMHQYMDSHRDSFAEASSFFPEPEAFRLGPDAYLEQLRRIKEAVRMPVIASLNGTTLGGWLEHARLLEQAGADAIELNLYGVPSDPREDGRAIEERTLAIVRHLRELVNVPIAAKISPFYTSLAHFAPELVEAGAGGLVLFHRLFQPDIDVEALEVTRTLHLSDSSELPLRLRWLAILSPAIRRPLAVSGGVHEPIDAVRALMAGASVVQLVSALLLHGPERLAAIRDGVTEWLEAHEYESVTQLRGSMSLARCPSAGAYLRANYIALLQSR